MSELDSKFVDCNFFFFPNKKKVELMLPYFFSGQRELNDAAATRRDEETQQQLEETKHLLAQSQQHAKELGVHVKKLQGRYKIQIMNSWLWRHVTWKILERAFHKISVKDFNGFGSSVQKQ
jgi:hypothetical protein